MLLRSATLTTPSSNPFCCAHPVTFPPSQPFAGGRRWKDRGSERGTLASPLPRGWDRTVCLRRPRCRPQPRPARAALFIWERLRALRAGGAPPGSSAGLPGPGAGAGAGARLLPASPRPSPGEACLVFLVLFSLFSFFSLTSIFSPFSCSETFSYVRFSPAELIYELGLAQAGAAGPARGGRPGAGAPAGLPSRGSAVSPPDMSCHFRQTFEVSDICSSQQSPWPGAGRPLLPPLLSSPAICVLLISCSQ